MKIHPSFQQNPSREFERKEFRDKSEKVMGFSLFKPKNSNKLYPYITSVIGHKNKSSDSLLKWRERVGDVEADRITKEASDFGTIIHESFEKWLENPNEFDILSLDMKYRIVFKQILDIFKKNITHVYDVEGYVYSDILGVAGRYDLLVDWKGVPAIVDLKTSRKPKSIEYVDDYFNQTTALSVGVFERYGLKCEKSYIISASLFGSEVFDSKTMKHTKMVKTLVSKFIEENHLQL